MELGHGLLVICRIHDTASIFIASVALSVVRVLGRQNVHYIRGHSRCQALTFPKLIRGLYCVIGSQNALTISEDLVHPLRLLRDAEALTAQKRPQHFSPCSLPPVSLDQMDHEIYHVKSPSTCSPGHLHSVSFEATLFWPALHHLTMFVPLHQIAA